MKCCGSFRFGYYSSGVLRSQAADVQLQLHRNQLLVLGKSPNLSVFQGRTLRSKDQGLLMAWCPERTG